MGTCVTTYVAGVGAPGPDCFPTIRPGRSGSAGRDRLKLCGSLGSQEGDLVLEVIGGLEGPVDRCEPKVGDLVELAERAEDGQADLVGRHLGGALETQGVLDRLAEAGQLVLGDRAALAGLAN